MIDKYRRFTRRFSPTGAARRPSGAVVKRFAEVGNQVVGRVLATTYVYGPDGTAAASVKQYIGNCVSGRRNWTYVWIWEQARAKWDVRVDQVAILAEVTPGTLRDFGLRWGGKGDYEVLSDPADTVRYCTIGYAVIGFYNSQGRYVADYARTAKIC